MRLNWASPVGGLIRYEFVMQFRRKALWIALAVGWGFIVIPIGNDRQSGLNFGIGAQLLLPLIAGYFLSDRLYRDKRLGTQELIITSGPTNSQYVLGKYIGVVGATLVITVIVLLGLTALTLPLGALDQGENYFTLVWPPLVVLLPAYVFIGAFCLAVPALLPLRLYQILFSCYWLWAFQGRFPSVYGTPLSPNGQFSLMLLLRDKLHSSYLDSPANWSGQGYFLVRGPFGWVFEDTPALAVLNVALLLGLGGLALVSLRYYLGWKEAHS